MKYKYLYAYCLLGAPVVSLTTFSQKVLQKPNFVLIIADDVSWDDIGCYGNRQVRTPNIDRLAENGIRLTNFFLTASSSSPSRNSIITGRYPHNTGGAELHTEPPDYMVSFPEILKKNGYYTAQAGKFHMGPYARRGFDIINEIGKLNGDGGEELWVSCLKERSREKPFFMWFAAYDAHRQWGPNEFSGMHDPESVKPPFYLAQGGKTKADLAKYYDEIARFDHYIGLVVNELDKQGQLDNTILIIMADNGRPFPHSKTRVNDRGLKSPFIIHWPAVIKGKQQVSASLVSAIDIAPTILDLAAISVPDHIQGKSFSSLLKEPDWPFRNYLFGEHNWHDFEAHERMVRSNDFLYILNSRPQFPQMGPADAVGSPSFEELVILRDSGKLSAIQTDVFITPRSHEELYDCISDPDQLVNIASVRDHQAKLAEMRQILKEWMVETGDNIPEDITKDWYEREPGYVKTANINIRGEPVDRKYNATKNNNKGRF
jgi:N-sulfoglucosamine sulfohydrolase